MADAITGIGSSFRAPLTALELIFGQGGSNAPAGDRFANYVCKMLSSGAAADANKRYKITSELQAAQLFGYGSEGHRIARMHIKVWPGGTFYITPHLPSSGSGVDSATLAVAWTGTATGKGEAVFDFMGEEIVVGFNTGTTATQCGDTLDAKIAAARFLPVTSTNTTGTNAIDAKMAGASQNSVHRVTLKSISSGKGMAVTVAGGTTGLLTGGVEGATTELSLFQAALSAITSANDYYLGMAANVTSMITEMSTHVSNRSLPLEGLRCRGFFSWTGAYAALVTIANGLNYERMQNSWQRNGDRSPDEQVAWLVASVQREEQSSKRFSFRQYSTRGFIKPALDVSAWPTITEVNDAMNEGITTIVSNETTAYMAVAVTTSSKDSTGTVQDTRKNLAMRVSIMDEVGAVLVQNHKLDFANHYQVADPLNPDGTINLNAINDFDPLVTCPFLFKGWVRDQLGRFFDAPQLLQNEAEWTLFTYAIKVGR